MKKVVSKLALVGLIFVFLIGNSGCKKLKKGVIEVRRYIAPSYINSSLSSPSSLIRDKFYCVIADENTGMISGEKQIVYHNTGQQTHIEYIYHENETPKSLGYELKIKGLPIGDGMDKSKYNNLYFTSKEGTRTPGKNSGFGKIAGYWKYIPTGEVIWIDSDKNGKGMLVLGGTKFPKEAEKGYCFTDIQNTGGNSYKFLNHTYFPGTGWVEGSYLTFEISEDRQSLYLGGVTYTKDY